MSSPYKINKKHIYKWREQNKEKFRLLNQKMYAWKKIQRIFLNILLE